MTPVDLPGCGWWEDGRVVVAGLYSPSLLSHSGLTWACGANWLLIASLYTGVLHMQKLAPSRETGLMRLSIRAWACLDTPIHNPLLLLAVLQASEDAPQVRVTCRKSACYHHTIMGLHRVSHPLRHFSDGDSRECRKVWR